MKTQELRAKGSDELKDIVVASKKELFNLRMQKATGAEAAVGRFKVLKKTIAKAKTLLNEKSASGTNAAPQKASSPSNDGARSKKIKK